jgi:uncharacterized protein
MNKPESKLQSLITRRRFFGGVCVGALATAAYARFFEAERLSLTRVAVPCFGERTPPIRLLHLSDLHASPVVSLAYLRRALDVALETKPDLICLTGDFVTQQFDDPNGYIDVLSQLPRVAPTFASLGNHDGGKWAGEDGGFPDVTWITLVLQRAGIELLHNASALCRVGPTVLQVVGVGDLWAGHFDAQRAFAQRSTHPTLLLSHNPDTKELVRVFDWQLMLSGHTHGGQLRVPWLGATPFAPVRDKRFVAGAHTWDGRWLHVTRGIGSVFGVRINCPPEVNLLTLT